MGSGSTGVAAARHGRDFLGNDLCAEAVEIARARLAELADPAVSVRPLEQGASQLGLGI
jgi:site-specific DNA-methyltransferase (adenine-specific)